MTSDSEFKCICQAHWTGPTCEIPLNSCAKKPCGPDAKCHILKTTDYQQDYVCVCYESSVYGLDCQEGRFIVLLS